MWAESVSTRWALITAAVRLLWCSTTRSATVSTPPTSPSVRPPPSSSVYYLHLLLLSSSSPSSLIWQPQVRVLLFLLCVTWLFHPADENLSLCWQHVTADLVCQSPLLGPQVTFMDCCCLYGEGWGMECALCPQQDSGKNFVTLTHEFLSPESASSQIKLAT